MSIPYDNVPHAGGKTFNYYINGFANDIDNEVTMIAKVLPEEEHQIENINPNINSFKEFELLTYFVDNKGLALSREKILNNVWNYDYFGDARTIDTHVKKLRKKLGDKGDYIKTIWGMGYKFEI